MAMKALTKATIYEVAQRAGVSIATVSGALRESDLVTDATRQRVLNAARDLHFTPSRLGRSLAEGRHAANGIVFPDLVGPYYAEMVLGYEAAAAKTGSSVLILATHGRDDPEAAVRDLATRVDGLAVMGRTVDDDVITSLTLPVVLLARNPVPGVDTVRTRNTRTAEHLADHLLAHGHRRIVFLGDPDAAPDVADRYRGLAKARVHLVRTPGFDLEAGENAAHELLRTSKPDAVVCANDELALGVLTAAGREGLRVPEDLAVTGWDDLLAARFANLTTVRQPMRELGATAARWLHRRINDRNNPAVRRRIVPTELVIRRSCGTHAQWEALSAADHLPQAEPKRGLAPAKALTVDLPQPRHSVPGDPPSRQTPTLIEATADTGRGHPGARAAGPLSHGRLSPTT